jgi:hypothetical protein
MTPAAPRPISRAHGTIIHQKLHIPGCALRSAPAGLSITNTTYGGPPFVLAEAKGDASDNSWGGTTAVSPILTLFNDAWTSATSKATALRVRVTLGNQKGAMLEFSKDLGQTWTVDVDMRNSTEAVNDSPDGIYPGFSFVHGTSGVPSFIDDLLIEDNVAPTPTPTPVPSAAQHWDIHE